MAGLDNNVLFLLTGESFEDSSYNKIAITNTKLTEANIEDEEIEGHSIKCINLNTTGGYLSFTLNDSFFNGAWTIDWWEKDSSQYDGLSGLFTNMTTSSGNYFGIGKYETGTRTFINMAQNGTYFVQTTPIGDDNPDVWVHKAFCFDGVNTYSSFVNGKLYKRATNTKKAVNGKHSWQIGRWRNTNNVALQRKIFNFRVSNIERWSEDFTPQIEKYDDKIEGGINIDKLEDTATLNQINEKIVEMKEGYETLRLLLIQALTDNDIEVDREARFQELIQQVKDLLSKEEDNIPNIFDSEPDNPFGSELYSKIRYRDKDGKDRVIYSKYVSNDYPCFNPSTNILYFSTKATYTQGYVYENDKWNTISEAYYGYLPSGVELDSVYSTSTNIGYHSTNSNYGQVWKEKTE